MTKEDVKMSGRESNKVSSTRSSSKSLKAENTQEETPRINSKRQRTPATVNDSNSIKYDTSLVGSKVKVWWPYYERFYEGVIASFDHVKKKHKVYYVDGDVEDINLSRERWEFVDDVSVKNGEANTIKYDNSLVGSKVKVWWPYYERFYEGVIASFDHGKGKHKVYYVDGDVEDINLRRERWEFIDDVSVKNGDVEVEHSCHGTSSDAKLKVTATESGGKSKGDGKQESEIKVNNSKCKSEGDSGKASGGTKSKDDSAKTPSHPAKQDRQTSSPMSKGKTPQSGNTLTIASSSSRVKESGKALPKTSSSSKGGEGNSIWPTEGTLHPQAIKSTLSQMLDKGIHMGVIIITSDGSFKAHKSTLSASSLVFNRMSSPLIRGRKVSTVEIKEMTSESCMALLSFLYGSLHQEAFLKHRLDLLGAANKYDIVDLKDVCEQSLLEDMNSGNVVERLQQAWVYELDKLKKGCFTYLLDSKKIYGVREDMNEFFRQADRGLLAEMFLEVLAVLKRN